MDVGREVGMAQFKHKPSSNIPQDFLNHFMSLRPETWKMRQSKFSASTSLTETISTIAKQYYLEYI